MVAKPRIKLARTLIVYSPYDEGYELRWICAGNNGLGLVHIGRTPKEAYDQWKSSQVEMQGLAESSKLYLQVAGRAVRETSRGQV